MFVTKSRREQTRCDRSEQAVAVGNARAEGDQREHVEIARDERLRATHEERPTAPQHCRRRERELHKTGNAVRQMQQAEMAAHIQRDDRQRQRQRNPEAARHVGEFAAVGFAAKFRFKRHATNRAGARSDLAYFRMHWASVDRVRRRAGRWRCWLAFVEIFHRVGCELAAAAGAAEMVGLVPIFMAMRALLRVDLHAAHRINRRCAGM